MKRKRATTTHRKTNRNLINLMVIKNLTIKVKNTELHTKCQTVTNIELAIEKIRTLVIRVGLTVLTDKGIS